ncbi:MAG TPA: hypothetical protein VGM58_01845 [Verrucomicrobiae bacterium]|jgi:hypothetical protein
MTNTVQFIGENKNWIFDGIGVFALTSIAGLIVSYFGWWQKRERLTIIPKSFSPAYDLECSIGGFDVETMQPTVTRGNLGVEDAKLKILCHNPTSTPITLDEIELINTDANEVIMRQDVKAQRIDAHDSVKFDVTVGSINVHYYKPPSWLGEIKIKTIRKKTFKSSTFNFSNLVS